MKTYHDVFVEQLIRRQRPGGETLFKCAVVLLALILLAAAFLWLRGLFPAIFALVAALVFFSFVYTVKEFEYSFINGDVDVDEIKGKRHRKQVLSFSCREVSLLAPCGTHEEALRGSFSRTVDASAGKNSANRWFLICRRQDGTAELVYFSPDTRLLDAFYGYLGRRMDYSPQALHKNQAE